MYVQEAFAPEEKKTPACSPSGSGSPDVSSDPKRAGRAPKQFQTDQPPPASKLKSINKELNEIDGPPHTKKNN